MLQMRVFSLNIKLKELDLRTDRDNSKLAPIGCQMGKGELALLLHGVRIRITLFVRGCMSLREQGHEYEMIEDPIAKGAFLTLIPTKREVIYLRL
jgi:hypothetical protein